MSLAQLRRQPDRADRRGKIKGWKQISAEEASKVLIQALVAGDAGLLETVMASPAELADAGVPKDVVAKIAADAEKRAEQLAALQKTTHRLERPDGLESI